MKTNYVSGELTGESRAVIPNRHKPKIKRGIFIALMLAWPVFQFLVFWIFINFDSILMTFQKFNTKSGSWSFVGLDNYKTLFQKISLFKDTRRMFVNSLWYLPMSCFVILPLCMITTYFLCRKMPLSSVFRVIFFLPSIIPLVILAFSFREMSMDYGLFGKIYGLFGGDGSSLMNRAFTPYLFYVWAGIGGNILLLGGAVNRIPSEIIESAKLDGIGTMREFFSIVVPIIWPTVVTLFIMSMMSVFGVTFQPLFLYNGVKPEYNTIGLEIYLVAAGGRYEDLTRASTLGIFVTVIAAPVILVTRHFLDKVFPDVDF